MFLVAQVSGRVSGATGALGETIWHHLATSPELHRLRLTYMPTAAQKEEENPRSWRWCLGRVSVRKRIPRLSGLADVHSHNRTAARGTVYTHHILCIAWPQAYLTLRRSSAPPKGGRSSSPPSPISIPGLCWLCPLETSTQSNKGCWLGIPRVNLSCLSMSQSHSTRSLSTGRVV